jgi:hypothetical protein
VVPRSYAPEFRRRVVELLLVGRSVSGVAARVSLFGSPCRRVVWASAEGISGAVSAGVEDGGGEGAAATSHGGRGVILDGDAVEWREQSVERPLDLVGLVADDALGERDVELGREFGGEGCGDFAE